MSEHKNIWQKIGMLILWIGLLAPMSARAQEDLDIPSYDGVILRQQEDKIEVYVKVNGAGEDGISALSLKLQVDQPETEAQFWFDPALEQHMVTESLYENGSLGLYIASDRGLFSGDEPLRLGELKVMPADDGKTMQINVRYDSLQTVNRGCGMVPVDVRHEPEPVSMLVGRDVSYGQGDGSGSTLPPIPEPETAGGDTGTSSGGSGGQKQDPVHEGLYDENTQYVNDPAEAQDIPSNVIRPSAGSALSDLTQQGQAGSALNLQAGGAASGPISAGQNVTVIDPGKGPSGMLVSSAGSTSAAGGGTSAASGTLTGGFGSGTAGRTDGAAAGNADGGTAGAASDALTADGTAGEDASAQTISFDQKNGGAVEAEEAESGRGKIGRLLIAAGIFCLVALMTGVAVSAILRERRRRLRRRRALARAKEKGSGKKRHAA